MLVLNFSPILPSLLKNQSFKVGRRVLLFFVCVFLNTFFTIQLRFRFRADRETRAILLPKKMCPLAQVVKVLPKVRSATFSSGNGRVVIDRMNRLIEIYISRLLLLNNIK